MGRLTFAWDFSYFTDYDNRQIIFAEKKNDSPITVWAMDVDNCHLWIFTFNKSEQAEIDLLFAYICYC